MMRKKRLPWLLGAGVCCAGALALFACKDDGDTITEYVNGGTITTTEKNYIDGGITVSSTYSNIDSETGLPTSGGYDSTVGVHDPMTVYDSSTGKWYAFGSHFAVASSEDLVHWTQEVDGSSSWDTCVSVAQGLYGTEKAWYEVLSRSYEYCFYNSSGEALDEDDALSAEYPSTWAPSVIKIGSKWYMYYSYTSNTQARSVIGRVSSSSILGPYADEEIILVSQGTTTSTSGNGPNCIDQEVFYDKDGNNLYMVYGSFYGGIFLIELDSDGTYAGFDADDIDPDGDYTDSDNTDDDGNPVYDYEGMAIEDLEPIAKADVSYSYFWGTANAYESNQAYNDNDLTSSVYGQKLWHYGQGDGSSSVGVEGPFIFYNDDTGYYYMMTSEGDLSYVYNMRIARNTDLAQGFVGINGKDVAGINRTRGGNKLAGNYKWADESTTYYALGHNSVVKKDNSEGDTEYFIVCHARTVLAGNHHLEVHQLYFNNEAWPVMSPNRYVGESLRAVDAATIAGSYDVIEHYEETVQDVAESVEYYFDESGTIYTDSDKGTEAGSWALVDEEGEAIGTDDDGNAETSYYITVTIGTDDDATEYNGVVAPGWRNYNPKGVWCITATSDSGRPMWANQAD